MSRIASSSSASGVRVAAQPLSNIYTVLLAVGAMALVVTLAITCIMLQGRYGSILPGSESARQALETARSRQREAGAELDRTQKALEQWLEGGAAGAETPGEAPAADRGAE